MPHRNLSAFLIENPAAFGQVLPGLVIPGKIDKLGYKGIDTTELIFDGDQAADNDVLINVAADSPKLTEVISGITRYGPESVFPTLSGWPKQSTRDHRRVIATFERRDAGRARMAMAEHFTIGVAPLTDHLIEHGVIAHAETPAQAAGS
jgi:FCD domain